jgi:hypothetical protein
MSEVNEALLAIRQKTIAQADPVEVQTEIPESTEEPAKQVAEEAPKDQPKEETPTEQSTETVQQETPSWDADEKPVDESPKFDLSKLGSALEFGEIKSESELVEKVSAIKSELSKLKEAPLSGIPDEFKEVIKVAQSGGDWRDYLSNDLIDYTKVDPVHLFEDTFLDKAVNNPKYFTDGKFDPNKAQEALDATPDPVKEFQGMQIADALHGRQKQKQVEARAQAEAKIVAAEKSLSKATSSLQELLPVESYGIKFEPKHSNEIYQGITSSKLTKQYLGTSYESLVANGADMKEIAATVAARHYLEKMIKFKAQNSKVEAKKEILEKTQNAQIKNTSTTVQPEDAEKKVLTPAEQLKKFYSQQQQKWL